MKKGSIMCDEKKHGASDKSLSSDDLLQLDDIKNEPPAKKASLARYMICVNNII